MLCFVGLGIALYNQKPPLNLRIPCVQVCNWIGCEYKYGEIVKCTSPSSCCVAGTDVNMTQTTCSE